MRRPLVAALVLTLSACSIEAVPQGSRLTVTSGSGPVVVDDQFVYWVTYDSVMRAPKAGGAAESLAIGMTIATQIVPAVDATSLYWLATDNLGGATLLRLPKGGGTPVELASVTGYPTALVVDDTDAYVACQSCGVLRVPKDGSGGAVVFAAGAQPEQLAIDAAYLYSLQQGGIVRYAKADATSTLLVQSASTMVVGANDVFYLAYASSLELRAQPKAGGDPVVLLTLGPDEYLSALVVDGSLLFWSNGEGRLEQLPTTGGLERTVAEGSAGWLATDDQWVYWIDYSDSGYLKRALKRTY